MLLAASPQSLTRLAAAGLGVGLLPDSLIAPADAVTLSPIKEPGVQLVTWMIMRRDEASPLAERIGSAVLAAAAGPAARS